MSKILNHRGLLLLAGLLLIAVAASACGKSEPTSLTFDLTIVHQKLTPSRDLFVVKQGDQVTFKAQGDEVGLLHLHGYDLEVKVTPGETAQLAFKADATGRFEIAWHPYVNAEETEGPTLSYLEVQPN